MILHSLQNNSSTCNQLGFIDPYTPIYLLIAGNVAAGELQEWLEEDIKNDAITLQERSRSLDSILNYTWKVLNYNYCKDQAKPRYLTQACGAFNNKPISRDRLVGIYNSYVAEALKHGEYVHDQNWEQSNKIIDLVANTSQQPKELVRDFLQELYAQWHFTPRRVSTDMFIYPNKTTSKAIVREEGRQQAEVIDQEARKEYENKESFWNKITDFFSGAWGGIQTTGKVIMWLVIALVIGVGAFFAGKFFFGKKIASATTKYITE